VRRPFKTVLAVALAAVIPAATVAVAAYKVHYASATSQSTVASLIAAQLGIDLNTYRLNVSERVSAGELDVWWTSEVSRVPTRVVSGGVPTRATPREYGENVLLVCYQGALLGRLSQFKTNWRHYHAYVISLDKVGERPSATVTAEGPDEAFFEARPEEAKLTSLIGRDEWRVQAAQCRVAVEPRVAADGAAPRR
jgi:hypothetical protein